jgi:hypothetical protein
MRPKFFLRILAVAMIFFHAGVLYGQSDSDSLWKKARKNIIRYNLSGSLLFGFDKYIVLGYERVVNPHQSFSINIGTVGLPKFVSINTDSFHLEKDLENSGFNASADYRFYLAKENKYLAPRGIYIGPFISYNKFKRENKWTFQESGSEQKLVTTNVNLNIFTVGAEMGYQFILWKRLAIDMILMGPGIANYNLKATYAGDLTDEQRTNLREAVMQLITQKFPGMNFVLADKELDANGRLGTWSLGFRYMINIGFNF